MNLSLSLSVLFSSVIEPGLETNTASTKTECIVQCFYSETCNSVFYDSSTNLCHFSKDNYDSPTSTMTSASDVVYIVVKSGNIMVVGPQSQCPTGGFTYNSSMNLCYKILETTGTADDHRATCQGLGGQLLALTSAARDSFLEALTQTYTNAFFFGAKYNGIEWIWENGAPYGEYLNWESGYPQNSQPCARKNRGVAEWKSFDCDRGTLNSVCEYQTGFSQALLTTCIP